MASWWQRNGSSDDDDDDMDEQTSASGVYTLSLGNDVPTKPALRKPALGRGTADMDPICKQLKLLDARVCNLESLCTNSDIIALLHSSETQLPDLCEPPTVKQSPFGAIAREHEMLQDSLAVTNEVRQKAHPNIEPLTNQSEQICSAIRSGEDMVQRLEALFAEVDQLQLLGLADQLRLLDISEPKLVCQQIGGAVKDGREILLEFEVLKHELGQTQFSEIIALRNEREWLATAMKEEISRHPDLQEIVFRLRSERDWLSDVVKEEIATHHEVQELVTWKSELDKWRLQSPMDMTNKSAEVDSAANDRLFSQMLQDVWP
jgi:hypothetical protein